MPVFSEYHGSMWHRIPVSILFFGLISVPGLFLTNGSAQINGAPSSVTSPGFGGRPVNGAPASVTSLGPRGYAPNSQVRFSTSVPTLPNGNGQHRHHHQENFGPPLLYAYPYPVPYAVDNEPPDSPDSAEPDANYQGGPTVFDRRGSGERSYVPPINDAPAPHAAASQDVSESSPAPAADPTLLVYKDGRQVEVGNYAIVGSMLYDLTPGHPRKIALADLDLEATRKQNDDRGIVFQLPPSLRTN